MSRAYLAGLLIALGLVGTAAVLVAVADLVRLGRVEPGTLGVMIIAFGCFFVVLGVQVLEPKQGTSRAQCRNCGARTFATLRSSDRCEVLTCFACGLEWAMPPLRARPVEPAQPGP